MVWNAADGKHVATRRTKGWSISCLGGSPDGKTLAIGDSSAAAWLWDWQADKPFRLSDFGDEIESVDRVLFSPDGKTLAIELWGSIELWDLPSRKLLFNIRNMHTNTAFSPDSKTIAVSAGDNIIKLLQVKADKPSEE